MSEMLETGRIDKTQFKVTTHAAQQADDRLYWAGRTMVERLEALEQLRVIHYGYDSATARLQRVFAVLERGAG